MDNTYISIDDATRVAVFMCRTGTLARDEDIKKRFYASRALDVQPIVRAHWIFQFGNDKEFIYCSNCEEKTMNPTPYCSNCGAKMEEYANECASCKLS